MQQTLQTLQTLQTSLTAPDTAQQLSLNAGDTETSVSFLNHLEPRYSGLGDDTAGSDLCPIRDDTSQLPPPIMCHARPRVMMQLLTPARGCLLIMT